MACARHVGGLRQPANPSDPKDRTTLGQHYREMAGRGGPKAAYYRGLLDGPEVPDALAYLWGIFLRLDGHRPPGAWGIAPFTFSEIDAFCRLHRLSLEPHEVDALLQLDGAIRHPEEDA